jgi:DNA polymerase-3 subunit gamma/tau
MQDILRAEGVAFEEAVLPLVVRAGAGSVRDSLSVLDQLLAGSDESGLSYDRAVALLGYTDASLLDEIVDAFATADGAAVFSVVNRVVEGGHEPRRFAADLLDRFRDLIILAAVPHAAETGLLDLAPDRAERMAAQAGRFGQAGLARAAEIVSASLDQMRGATSPRLLLELMCAQVLLPAATTDEKSLLTRLERLESGRQGRPVPVSASPPHPLHSGPHDDAERTGVPATADRKASPPAETAAPASAPAATPPAPAPAPSAGTSAADSLGKNWNAVVEAVKQESRVAWALLRNASVVSLDGGILTLRFPSVGEMKGFSVSGHDAVLKRVLSTEFGLNVTIKGVTGTDPGGGSARPADPVSPGPSQGPAPDGTSDPAALSISGSISGSSSGRPARDLGRRPRRDEPPAAEIPPDDMPPDEPDGDQPPVTTELTGMDLIQRELGGQVIGEIED